MRRMFSVGLCCLVFVGSVSAKGLLIPEDKKLPPLALVQHKVKVTIEDQVALTKVAQTFRNHTDRQLEATYVFPVPRGASVNGFSMLLDGKEVKGELVEAAKAREIYTSIVRQAQDPGLLEYLGHNLLRFRVFPIPPNADQRVDVSFTAITPREQNLVEYVYPLKTTGSALTTLKEYSIDVSLKSQHGIANVYSPTHAITLKRTNDKEVVVNFEREQATLDRDFLLYYSLAEKDKDIGLTLLTHRPVSSEPGYFMMVLSPKAELAQSKRVPRDLVLVLDTSGSMKEGTKMEQARKALQHVLGQLSAPDRFAVLNFGTTVHTYKSGLLEANAEQLEAAKHWVGKLEPNGGTAIDDALAQALDLRPKDDAKRSFTVIFFTDGQPTIGETKPEKILKNVANKNSLSTRIFTFGVGFGDKINASLLDQLAEQTRAVSTFVRPEEDIQTKVGSLYGKISHPVMTNLKLQVTNDMEITEVYPPQLPDLFHGSQVVVLGRYSGKGAAAIQLLGSLGDESKTFVYESTFPGSTSMEGKTFVEDLWARRKVGYLLDQIRLNGENKELVEEVVKLAKKHGITTPYTSYLIVPDTVMPLAAGGFGGAKNDGKAPGTPIPEALAAKKPGEKANTVQQFLQLNTNAPDDLKKARETVEEKRLNEPKPTAAPGEAKTGPAGKQEAEAERAVQEARDRKKAFDQAKDALTRGDRSDLQSGQRGVELSKQTEHLRYQCQVERRAQQNVAGRNCLELGGIWIDDAYRSGMKNVVVKAQSDAYFRILERHPQVKSVFTLGNHLVWITPSGTALIIDTSEGQEKLDDAAIDQLFAAKK